MHIQLQLKDLVLMHPSLNLINLMKLCLDGLVIFSLFVSSKAPCASLPVSSLYLLSITPVLPLLFSLYISSISPPYPLEQLVYHSPEVSFLYCPIYVYQCCLFLDICVSISSMFYNPE